MNASVKSLQKFFDSVESQVDHLTEDLLCDLCTLSQLADSSCECYQDGRAIARACIGLVNFYRVKVRSCYHDNNAFLDETITKETTNE